MTFEEFFKKKKISLALLQQAEPVLFAEFKIHFEQMGEKSFDHTKKYWFNKLRRLYVLPPEPKVEKIKIENQVAEQTIIESLSEEAAAKPKPAFQPRFKAGTVDRPAEAQSEDLLPAADAKNQSTQKPDEPATVTETVKPVFKPRFKPAASKPAAEQENTTEQASAPAAPNNTELPGETQPTAAKPAFKPRFKPGVTKAASPVSEPVPDQQIVTEDATATAALPASTDEEPAPAAGDTPKPVFKPRFKPGLTKNQQVLPATAPAEQEMQQEQTLAADTPDTASVQPGAVEEPVKPAYKPRFKPGMAKPKPPEE